MELGSITCAKHLGGVESIRLLSAHDIKSIYYDPWQRAFSDLELRDESEFLEVHFAERTASLEERVGADGLVTHTLRFGMQGYHHEAAEVLRRLSVEGMVAVVELAEGETLLVGYSPEVAADSPLRLSEARFDSGGSRTQRASTTFTLSSCDGSLACHFEE